MSVNADEYILNDIDVDIVKLHEFLLSYCDKQDDFFEHIFKIIDEYGFSISYKTDVIPQELKKKNPKTYYAKYNKEKYNLLKEEYNSNDNKDLFKLYLLLIYGFNHMIRFNKNGDFNLPVGNVDFNKNVYDALNQYFIINKSRRITLNCLDFEQFIKKIDFISNSFVYFDPPYFISLSEYNKLWKKEDELRLYDLLDFLNEKGVKFGITNLLEHKGKKNIIFEEFSKRYKSKVIKSNYISYNDNSVKNSSVELYVYNY